MKTDPNPPTRKWLIAAAGLVTLLVSDLPNLVWHWFQAEPGWLDWAKAALLAAFLFVTLAFKALRPLWKYAAIFLAFFLARGVADRIGGTALWQEWFGGKKAAYAPFWWGQQLSQVLFTLIVLAVTWLIFRRRQAFFLGIGK